MRNAYEPAPWLAASNTPAVKTTTGLGTGGGAGVNTPDSGGFGDVILQVGSNPSAGGTVGNNVTVTWGGTPRLNSNQYIHYEWADTTRPN